MTAIHYATLTEHVGTGRVTWTHKAYTPTLEHARAWATLPGARLGTATDEKWDYIIDLLGIDLTHNGGNYVSHAVYSVASVFEVMTGNN